MHKTNCTNNLHPDFYAAQKDVYEPSDMNIKNVIKEPESQDYGACTFEMNDRVIVFRVAKTTPTKIGQFVTLWKRIGKGPILPFDLDDPVELFVVSVRHNACFGQFVFPKTVLFEKGFVSKNGQGGKRAMRVYSPWDIPESSLAKKTQAWQLLYFFEINKKESLDVARVRKLFL